ncbi:MAG: DUF2064 domain-containing protein [Nitriliruptorales bacterium]|nr:DUF2064 domain-containing protein [Nitriliruptorales bacterium]
MAGHSGGLIVLAKAPRPGLVKTRLVPPLSFSEAALLARAALLDTLDTVVASDVPRRALVLDGPPGPWIPAGVEVVAQRGRGLAERLANAVADVGGPVLLIGMDSPQVTPAMLTRAWARLHRPEVDALLGLAPDGGWWAIGLTEPIDVFRGVPTSTPRTGWMQLSRLLALGLRTELLPVLRDLDDIDDLLAVVAASPPGGRLVEAVQQLRHSGGVPA